MRPGRGRQDGGSREVYPFLKTGVYLMVYRPVHHSAAGDAVCQGQVVPVPTATSSPHPYSVERLLYSLSVS